MRNRLPSTDAAKEHWRANPTLRPQEIQDLFQIPPARVYRLRKELVQDQLMSRVQKRKKDKAKNPRAKAAYSVAPGTPESVGAEPISHEVPSNAYQVGGTHYKEMGVEPWDVIEATLTKEEFAGFLKGNIIKYSMRQTVRGKVDADKCRHYIVKLDEMSKQWHWN